jgi:hypothetical protein
MVVFVWCPGWELNPHSPCGKTDFKSVASADFATRAHLKQTSYEATATSPPVTVGEFVGRRRKFIAVIRS